jgi:DNA-binding GntR family transcriptional regulator
MLENLQNQIWLFRRKTYSLSSSVAPDAHDAIVSALEDGDRGKAEEIMREHISTVRKKLLEHLSERAAKKPAETPVEQSA